jgi:peptidoglycan/LPS O-acetylase OafA/YrhL
MTGIVEPRADLPALTGIRGVAAWLVVFYHARLALAPHLPAQVSALLRHGYLAVDLFFMLSGFVLWLNYGDRLRRDGFRVVPHFLGRRIARIWPLHALMLLAAIGLALLLMVCGRPVSEPWSLLPLHFLLVHNWGFTDRLSWNDPSWSISGEFAAYLVFPLLAASIDWRRFAPALLLAILAALAAALHHAMSLGGATLLDNFIPRLGIFRALIEFAMGTILCALWMHWRSGRRAAMVAGLVALIAYLVLAWPLLTETALAPIALAGALLLIAITADARLNPLASRPIHYLGLISYSTYLVHFLLYKVFKLLFVAEDGPIAPPLLGLYFLLTLAASILLFHGVERPGQRLMMRLFERRGRRASAQPSPA